MLKARFIAAALMTALVAGPVILDACAFTCHETAGGAADASEPTCHHVGQDEAVRLVPPPAACGHDHSPAPSITTTVKAPGADSSLPAVVSNVASTITGVGTTPATSGSGPPRTLHGRSASPLRL